MGFGGCLQGASIAIAVAVMAAEAGETMPMSDMAYTTGRVKLTPCSIIFIKKYKISLVFSIPHNKIILNQKGDDRIGITAAVFD
ncbi:hypothetical protein FE784_22795 [Paenibacillus hemerocallicola]|uniref:Uncharacterized protein n=1 Tax=Paenibacillus hemerocallicola TaxID=1172614 RepID=A0A5C4T579_9BACL|nr:hypothetical protein [Paenibacillus hemerocallicola]TNJ63986.1 hypothetical protein FE784_22795 [Paenibacillus hemerocallicola]